VEEVKLIDAKDSQNARLILTGVWYCANIVPKEVSIYAMNYDFYYDLYNDPPNTPR
jgi:hypothetical protein